jgi:putative membrane protein
LHHHHEIYDFWDMWNPDFIFLLSLIALIYLLAIGPLRYLVSGAGEVGNGQKLLFLSGLFVLYAAMGSPLHIVGHDMLFSAHMLEQSLVYMVAPPLLLIGIPSWLLRPVWEYSKFIKVRKLMFHPLTATLSFNVLFSFYHVPMIFDKLTSNVILHTVAHIVLFIAALQMWWVITTPLRDENPLSELRKMGFVIANGILLYPACALIIFADTQLYLTYRDVPQLFSFLPPMHDQQLGGVAMKLVQEGVFIVTLGVLFYQWYKKENKGVDPTADGSGEFLGNAVNTKVAAVSKK